MGSVITHDEECPHCHNNNVYSDFNYKTQEEFRLCNQCGWYYSLKVKRNEDLTPVLMDKNLPATLDNVEYVETLCENPCGYFRIEMENGYAQVGPFPNPETYSHFCKEDYGKHPEIKIVTISSLTDGEIKEQVIYEKLC